MNIIIVGRGVIGTAYGSVLSAAGHTVQHLLRGQDTAAGSAEGTVHLTMLDGRDHPPTEHMSEYTFTPASFPPGDVDLVLVSVPADALAGALEDLRSRGYNRRLVLMGGVWLSGQQLDDIVGHHDYVLGYPIAGGRRDGSVYETVLFDSVRLQRPVEPAGSLHADAVTALRSAGLTVQQSGRMLEWLWLHQAVNAGIIAAIAARHAPGDDLGGTVRAALSDPGTLSSGIRNIRECLRVVTARGVRLRHHLPDVAAFLMPTALSSRLMVAMFRRDVLSRRIMELHHNLDDILALMTDVERTARDRGVSTPGFDRDYGRAQFVVEKL
jgi:ketopantoate reductase